AAAHAIRTSTLTTGRRRSSTVSEATDEQLDLLAKHGHVRPTEVGEVLFREGDTTYDVMVLLDGTVAVLVGSGERMRELAIQRPRDLMAELNILTGQRVHANGVVREAGSILVVPADEFRALLGRELVFGDFVLQTLFRRRQAIERLRMGIQIVGSASTATRTGSASSPPA